MDRTSRIGVAVCLAILLYLLFLDTTNAPKHRAAAAPAPATPSLTTTAANAGTTQAVGNTPAQTTSAPANEQLAFLENGDLKITLTSLGAAIKEIELKKHKEDKGGNVVLNEQSHSNVMELTGWPGADTISFTSRLQPEIHGLIYTTTLANGVKWERSYTLGPAYALTVKDTLTNPGAAEITLPAFGIDVGRAEPLRVRGHYQQTSNMYLGCGWLTMSHFHLTTINDFNPGFIPFVGIKTHAEKDYFESRTVDPAPIRWLGAENQFFAVLLTPTPDHLIDHAGFQCYNARDSNGSVSSAAEPDIEATGFFPEVKIPAGGSVALNYNLYAGTKDYDGLNALGEQQGELMNYGKFELLIVPMLWTLRFFYSFLHNYGGAIILLTLCIKIVTWPLQSVANRSGKRMQALAPKIKELQAKHKEHPEKLNTETFALYREYGVNPFKGCLPAIIQMPIFFSLYYMLQNAGELRGQSFLWVHDLTQPDTVATWHHFALNPLPLMVTGLTMVMMRMTPQIGDPAQAKIAQFMPLIFLFIFYNFAAALSLYYVINNCVSIIQIYRNLRKPLPELKRMQKKKA
jgi:YidC/Oxa1 family membrane protein insertase